MERGSKLRRETTGSTAPTGDRMTKEPTRPAVDTPRRPRGRPRRDASLAPGDPGVLTGPDAEVFARAILHALPTHIAVLEPDGRVIGVNKAWEVFTRAA